MPELTLVGSPTWLTLAEAEIERSDRLCPGCARATALRLGKLLLQRLGPPLADELLQMMPEAQRVLVASEGAGDRSIGLPDFISHAGFVLGLHEAEILEATREARLRRIALAFLHGAVNALPEALGYRVEAALPAEIRYAAEAA
ncbi:MAG: hypothetical protein KGQ59_01750 [Bdellovibrionales bacterium]|nr:hypothetical protein [Bdellovibrionales bacterium]